MVFVEMLMGMNRDFFVFWGYLVVFVSLLLESFPFIGAFVPGGIIILLISGLLAKLGFFVLWKVVLVLISASILIDIFGYFLGKFISKDFFHRHAKILFIKKETLEKVGRIVHGHTGKSLIFGKLNPITRSIAPFVVGNEKVNFGKFFFYSIIGAVLWVTMFVFIGYIFGNSFQGLQSTEKYILWSMIVLLGGYYIYHLRNLFKEFFSKNKKGGKNGINRKK